MSQPTHTSMSMPPAPIAVCFLIDIALALAFVIDYWIDHSHHRLTNLLHLSQEANLPTWYSSVQWFAVAALLGLFAARQMSRSARRSWALAAFPLLFLLLSLDEVASIHEKLAHLSDQLLPGGDRKATAFPRTGIWMFVLGPPFIAVLWALIVAVKPYAMDNRRALARIAVGMAVMLSGALAVETFINLFEPDTLGATIQIFIEELLEMLGATIVLWGSYELARIDDLIGAHDTATTPAPPRSPS